MGIADVIPGVSGGTIALILGIYTRLIQAIRNVDLHLLRATFGLGRWSPGSRQVFAAQWRRIDGTFLILLATGIGMAIIVASTAITYLLDHHAVVTFSVFFGLILASALIPWSMLKRRGPRQVVALIVGVVAAYVFTGLPLVASPADLWFVPVAAAFAICAMILPGVSGAFLLLVIGMYAPTLQAVHDRDVAYLGLFILGAAAGLLAFSRLLGKLLDRHHDATFATLTGLMVGSLRRLWPFKADSAEEHVPAPNVIPEAWTSEVTLAFVGVVAGVVIALALERLGRGQRQRLLDVETA